ncbi:hypothetical protein [Antrihabitans cavernicola]|uniref:Uncharacterized protein n=1 Tax=Antrihabitans cavernicola TaxID=2495913 RepID=A0A5A7S351_9NOCA|nr:hypothetical protein [Spelaeibacter cavernicola]KAA0018936.1 hypothetical protein FOY51_23145 [Spelaeibacter cavernicola]
MATGLGLRVGDAESVAAIVTSGRLSEPEYVVRPTVLHMSDDGDTVLGDAPADGTYKTVSDFVGHVGDPEGISVDQGDAYRAEDLVATAMFCLINEVGDRLGEPNRIVATYPAEWTGPTVDSVRDSLDYLGLNQVKLVRQDDAGSDKDLALGAALVAHDAASGTVPVSGAAGDPQDMTEEFPVTAGPMVGAQAYSTATEIPIALPPLDVPPSSQIVEAEAVPEKRRKTPLIIAAGAAAVLALGGGAVAIALQSNDTTEVPTIRDAPTSAVVPPTTTRTSAPVVFAPPTQTQEQESVAPQTTQAPAPPPPPPVTTPPPPPPVTTPQPPPPTTEPPVTVAPTTVPSEEPTETDSPTTTRHFPTVPNPYGIPTFPRPGDPNYPY